MSYKITKSMVISSAIVLGGASTGGAYIYTSTQPAALELQSMETMCHKYVSILGYKLCYNVDPYNGECYGSEPGPCP